MVDAFLPYICSLLRFSFFCDIYRVLQRKGTCLTPLNSISLSPSLNNVSQCPSIGSRVVLPIFNFCIGLSLCCDINED